MSLEFLGGRRLLLAGSRLGWIWMLALAAAVVLLLVLYREERRLVTRRAGLFLLSLRLAAAASLAFALFEPIAARTLVETERGRVIVAVDVSESMTTVDPNRTSEQNAKLAQAVGLKSGAEVAKLSRREVARRLIDGESSPIGRLEEQHAVEAVAFARETAPASLMTLAKSLKTEAKAGDSSRLETDWEPALARALQPGSTHQSVSGVVLLTDGRQNGPGDPLPTIDRLAARGVPVYSVLIGSSTPPRDAAVAAVKAPESVYRGDVATVSAAIKIDAYAGRAVAVTLERPGASPMRQTVQAPASPAVPRPVVSFAVPLEQTGTVPLSVAVEPLPGDVRPDNDRRTISIQVVDDKARVLLVDSEPRWELRYLRNALQRDARVELRTVVFHQTPMSGAAAHPYETAVPPRGDTNGDQPDPLGGFDAIILGDVGPAEAPSELWERLDAFVGERGGTLVFCSGLRNWASLAIQETARKLLPVVEPRLVEIDASPAQADQTSLPPGALIRPLADRLERDAWPMLQLDADPERNRAIWNALPRMPWLVAGRAKPGATVLAVAGRGDGAAVMAAQPYGLGKVLWIGTDGTWRFRFRTGDRYHHRFWGQVVRWAAAETLAAGNAQVRFGPVKPRYEEGESVKLQARINEGVAGVGPELLIAAKIFKIDPSKPGTASDEPVAIVRMRPVAGQPRTFGGDVPGLEQGSYAMRLDVPQLVEVLELDQALHGKVPEASIEIVSRESSERVELAAARDQVEQLASATGGRVLADYEAGEVSSLLRDRTQQTTRVVEKALWDQPGFLVLFFGILTVEWVARKRVGLP
jgi:hypothetical protein